MGFTVWDTASRNALGYFETEAEALSFVRELIEDQGPTLIADLLLLRQSAEGQADTVAIGTELVQRALTAPAIEALEQILELVVHQRASHQPDLDAIEQTARAALQQATGR